MPKIYIYKKFWFNAAFLNSIRTSKKTKLSLRFHGVKKFIIVQKWLQQNENNVKQFSDFNNL